MKFSTDGCYTCAVCGKLYKKTEIISAECISTSITNEIKASYPHWNSSFFICRGDLSLFRARYIHSLLMTEKGELSILEHAVIDSLDRNGKLLSTDIDNEIEGQRSFFDRVADKVSRFGGSWWFIFVFTLFISMWIGINTFLYWWKPMDPYPYIFLNLLLSCIAAIQAPFIMISQNRQENKDRIRSQYDYKINLKAELEIRQLHEKIDHLLHHQWERMVKIQEIQIEMLAELTDSYLRQE